MSYKVPQCDIEVENVEVRTSKNGKPYLLVTDSDGEKYGDWREDGDMGDRIETGNRYGIEYTLSKCGNYKNIKVAFKKEKK